MMTIMTFKFKRGVIILKHLCCIILSDVRDKLFYINNASLENNIKKKKRKEKKSERALVLSLEVYSSTHNELIKVHV
jgi:hypothetical protein